MHTSTITSNCITTFVFHIVHAYFAHFIFHSARTVAIEVTVIALRLFKVDNIVDCHKITINISVCVRTELNFVITVKWIDALLREGYKAKDCEMNVTACLCVLLPVFYCMFLVGVFGLSIDKTRRPDKNLIKHTKACASVVREHKVC